MSDGEQCFEQLSITVNTYRYCLALTFSSVERTKIQRRVIQLFFTTFFFMKENKTPESVINVEHIALCSGCMKIVSLVKICLLYSKPTVQAEHKFGRPHFYLSFAGKWLLPYLMLANIGNVSTCYTERSNAWRERGRRCYGYVS
jgi:hypothetical protein